MHVLRTLSSAVFALYSTSLVAAETPTVQRPIDQAKAALARQQPVPGTTDKIVGGKPASPGKFPFQVALIAAGTPKGQEHFGQFCGGSLIDRNWVLTAAHCVPNTKFNEVEVYIGATVLPSGQGTTSGSVGERLLLAADGVIPHRLYNDRTSDNDIALLKLKEPAPASFVPAVPATPEQDGSLGAVGKKATVIGWGATQEGGSTTPRLMEVEVTVQDRDLCEANYQAVVPGRPITENMWCAGKPEGGLDSCQGDSGGFIGAPASDGRWVQLGVVSWGIGCARPELFGVYTRVANYENWIQEVRQQF